MTKTVEIITIGDEILIGQIVDTNSAWMAVELNKAGFVVKQISSVGDSRQHILNSIDEAFSRADIVLMTGGIGPTKDDITKHVLCEYFNTRLIFSEEEYGHIEAMFAVRGRKVNELTKAQAMVPEMARVFRNKLGTAPVTWFEKDDKVLVSMPGVPYEMMGSMTSDIIPALKSKYETKEVKHKTFLVKGFPESELAMKIASWEDSLGSDLKLAYLPNFGLVKLRLSGVHANADWLNALIENRSKELREILGSAIIAEEDLPLEKLAGMRLHEMGVSLATAESCTGGLIGHTISSVPGSSGYYKGTIVAYANEVKVSVLGVDPELIESCGAVSKEVAEMMSQSVLGLTGADYAISSTGIAGPDGGTPEKPVGTVWISVSSRAYTRSECFHFKLNRKLNVERSVQNALLMLLEMLEVK